MATLDHHTENNVIPEIFDQHFGLHEQGDADVEAVTLRTREVSVENSRNEIIVSVVIKS